MNRQLRRKKQQMENASARGARRMVRNHAEEIVKEAALKELNRAREEAFNDAVNQAMILLLALPMKVLKDIYWPGSYKKKLPGFTEHVLEYYDRWQNGEWEIDDLIREIEEETGITIKEEET